uniref:Uncharacterized protein n=1 Tax=Mimivirus LCMiAC01 TaxID=2506608 RepID=A0A481Z139_9VIRU|nr:MAG: hypothetical protein LCMiAC01_04790 [Mimivirus LCMiAC01]
MIKQEDIVCLVETEQRTNVQDALIVGMLLIDLEKAYV